MQIESSERGFEYGVRHFRNSEPISLELLLKASLDLGPMHVRDLLTFGAVYINGKRQLELPSAPLSPGTLVRVHTKPRRYPMNSLNLTQIVFENEDFLVFNKPSGVPVHATVDNMHENVIGFLQSKNRQALTTHRLDVATSGLLVIAKTLAFQKLFNQVIAENKTQKIYRALSHGNPPKLGRWTHFMEPSPRAPKKVVREAKPDHLRCDLEVLESKLTLPGTVESRIQLLSGRTHQIRAQLSVEGSPVVGDVMYGSSLKFTQSETICLQACELSFVLPSGENFEFKLDHSPWQDRTPGLRDQIETHLKVSQQ